MSDLKFCPDCNNILYTKPDTQKLQLMFLCRQCDYSRMADPNSFSENCVNRTTYNFQGKDDIIISPLIVKDPTLGRTTHWTCVRCGWNKAAFFQLPERVNDEAMMLVFVCCNQGCGYWAKQVYEEDEEEEEETDAINTLGTTAMTQMVPPKEVPMEAQTFDDMAELFGEDGI